MEKEPQPLIYRLKCDKHGTISYLDNPNNGFEIIEQHRKEFDGCRNIIIEPVVRNEGLIYGRRR